MRETVGSSSRAYFILSGLVSGAGMSWRCSVASRGGEDDRHRRKSHSPLPTSTRVRCAAADRELACARSLAPHGGLFLAFLFGIGLLHGRQWRRCRSIFVIGLLITLYLFANVRRALSESQAGPAAPVHPRARCCASRYFLVWSAPAGVRTGPLLVVSPRLARRITTSSGPVPNTSRSAPTRKYRERSSELTEAPAQPAPPEIPLRAAGRWQRGTT